MHAWKELMGDDFRWINIDHINGEVINTLETEFQFHRLDLDDCLSKMQLPKIDEYDNYLFIILHFPRYLKTRRLVVPMQVAFFLGRNFLVTVHSGDLKPINRIFDLCSENDIAHNDYLGKNPAFLMYRIILALLANLLQMSAKVMSNIEALEPMVFNETIGAVREVTELRHEIANLRRTIFPLRRVIHELEKTISSYTDDENIEVYFGNLTDTISKISEIIDACKEISEIYKDTDYIISSDRTNKILTVLTMIVTFSIPITIIGTLYGMNVRLPGGIDDAPAILGPYSTFIILLAIAAVMIAAMYFFFRKFRWL